MGNAESNPAARAGENGIVEEAEMAPAPAPISASEPAMFAPQRPIDAPAAFSSWMPAYSSPPDLTEEKGIPTLLTWNLGGEDVVVEGSWDNWSSRKQFQKAGKDHDLMLVLPPGVYHYRILVDGEAKLVPGFPLTTDDQGQCANILDIHDYVPENLDNVVEFEPPPSPDQSYDLYIPGDVEYTKEPPTLPPQLLVSVLSSQNTEEPLLKPQHVVLNHLYIEKGRASQSLLALGLTHRFQSKYVTVVLYKPLRR